MSGLEVQNGPSKPGATGNGTKTDDDPAEYLFKSTKYHDCKITVTDPVSKEVEHFGVVSSHLAAQSSKLRALLEELNVEPKELKIGDISPQVFKLMLIFAYGGNLPDMDRATAAQLALGSMIYGVKKLVVEASKRLEPSCVEDVFPALFVVAHIDQNFLSPKVKKIVQEQTVDLFKTDEFLELDQKCIEFIAAQEQLSVSELELWNSLVKWAQSKAEKGDNRSLRDILYSTLQYVRFATMNQNDIIKEVMPKKILSSSEVTDLLLAISSNLPWESPGMCKNHNQRELCDGTVKENDLANGAAFQKNCTLTYAGFACPVHSQRCTISMLESSEYEKFSAMTITTSQAVQLISVTFQSRSLSKDNTTKQLTYNLSCTITVCKSDKGFCKDSKVLQVGGVVFCNNEIEFPMKLRNGQLLALEANCTYYVGIEFSSGHPVYKLNSGNAYDHTLKTYKPEGMSITSLTCLHLKQLSYRL